jgi:hypothetical protein
MESPSIYEIRPQASASDPQPGEQSAVAFVDPTGLEADGAGAVEATSNSKTPI